MAHTILRSSDIVIKVKKELMDRYNLDENTAKNYIEYFEFEELANESPEEVSHYPSKYWADELYDVAKSMNFDL